jgi:hypothetical protein
MKPMFTTSTSLRKNLCTSPFSYSLISDPPGLASKPSPHRLVSDDGVGRDGQDEVTDHICDRRGRPYSITSIKRFSRNFKWYCVMGSSILRLPFLMAA